MAPVDRLLSARLYLIAPISFLADGGLTLAEVVRAGVDVVQLRDKRAEGGVLLEAANRFREICADEGCLFIVNDRVDLAMASGADGVHLGQDDLPVTVARRLMGPEAIIGLSTHSQEQIAQAPDDADYLGVGPVHPTPTKQGRLPVGLDLVRWAAANARSPFFAIGGIDPSNVREVSEAGASRVSVMRAICDASDPELAARSLIEQILSRDEEAEGRVTP